MALEARVDRAEQRMGMVEQVIERYTPVVDELELAQRVTEGVRRALDVDTVASMNRWQKWGIAIAVASAPIAAITSIVQARPW